MVRVVGQRLHGDRLGRIGSLKTKDAVNDALEKGAHGIAKIAKDSIIEGSVSGPGHVPSKPGEPPNADTHELDQSIIVTMDREKSIARVIATADYAPDLERGNSKIEPRPFMKPAGQKGRPEARRLVNEAKKSTL